MTYRDGLGPRWQSARDEIGVALARLEQLPYWVLTRAPKPLRERLAVAPALAPDAPESLEAIEQAEGALAELRAALDEAEALAARGERVVVVPGQVIGLRPAPSSGAEENDSFPEQAAEFSRLIATFGTSPEWVAHDAVAARFERGGVEYSLRLSVYQQHRLTTQVPDGGPEFQVVPQTGFDDLLQALRLQKRPKVGDEGFDTMFRIVGDGAVDERCVGLLGPPVRGALFLLARVDVPSLEIGGGEASVSWSAPPSLELFERAKRALDALRAALGAAAA
jgi:hypothetical protein